MRRELSCSLTFVLYEYFCWLRSQKRNCWLSICTHWIGKPAAKLLSKQAETIYIPSNNDENVQATFKDPFPRSHKPLNAFRGREEWSTFTPAPPPLHTWNSRRQITSFSKSRGRGISICVDQMQIFLPQLAIFFPCGIAISIHWGTICLAKHTNWRATANTGTQKLSRETHKPKNQWQRWRMAGYSIFAPKELFLFLFIYFLWPHPWHAEVPGSGIEPRP